MWDAMSPDVASDVTGRGSLHSPVIRIFQKGGVYVNKRLCLPMAVAPDDSLVCGSETGAVCSWTLNANHAEGQGQNGVEDKIVTHAHDAAVLALDVSCKDEGQDRWRMATGGASDDPSLKLWSSVPPPDSIYSI